MPVNFFKAEKGQTKRNLKHSQNFISRKSLVNELLEISKIGSNDTVLEIGAGKGAITSQLVKRAGFVIAVEQDKRLSEHLRKINGGENLKIINRDFRDLKLPEKPFKVFSNIPFDITTEIIGKLTSGSSRAAEIYLIMQEEAAERFAGMPYRRNSQNSILLATEFHIKIIRKISRDFFRPKPNVNIVFAEFSRLEKPLIPRNDKADFRSFVIYGFNRCSPGVLDAFKKIFSYNQIRLIKKSQNIQNLKPSDLSVNQWIMLFDIYKDHVSEDKKAIIRRGENKFRAEQKKLKKWNRSRTY